MNPMMMILMMMLLNKEEERPDPRKTDPMLMGRLGALAPQNQMNLPQINSMGGSLGMEP